MISLLTLTTYIIPKRDASACKEFLQGNTFQGFNITIEFLTDQWEKEEGTRYYDKAQVTVAGEQYQASFKTGKNKESKQKKACYVYVNLDASVNTE